MTISHCGQMGRNPAQLMMDWLLGGGTSGFLHADKQSVIFTQSGQSAILLAARLWSIGENDEVLVPAYNCGSEISPYIATGAKVSMYRVDENAQIDVCDLMSRITLRTRLVHVTHYFGRPTKMGELVSICRKRQIKLLEDCALSLFSDDVAQLGDAAIFSLRKSLPVCDGGVLLLRNADEAKTSVTRKPPIGAIAHELLVLVKNWLQNSVQLSSTFRPKRNGSTGFDTRLYPRFPDIPDSYYCNANAVIYQASRFSLGMLKRSDPQEIGRRRRLNYVYLRQRLTGTPGLSFLWKELLLPDGICPLGLPVLVHDKPRWWRDLNAAGVAVSPWWEGYHRGVDWSQFPEARALKNHLLLLPVHQYLSLSHMDYVANVIRLLAARHAVPSPVL
jgi:perosamine synthetase